MIKTMINQQITRDIVTASMKINQLTFIQDLVIKKVYNKYNINIILNKVTPVLV